MKYVAGQEKLRISGDTTATATIGIGPRGDRKGFSIDVEPAFHVPNLDQAAAKALVQKAHIVCPCSHATKGNVDVRLKVVGSQKSEVGDASSRLHFPLTSDS